MTQPAARTDVHIDLADRSYAIHIGSGLLSDAASWQGLPKASAAFIVTNDTVGPLYAAQLQAALAPIYAHVRVVSVPDGEAHKDWATLNLIFDALLERRASVQANIGTLAEPNRSLMESLGIYPTMQTLVAQLVVTALVIAGYTWLRALHRRPPKLV